MRLRHNPRPVHATFPKPGTPPPAFARPRYAPQNRQVGDRTACSTHPGSAPAPNPWASPQPLRPPRRSVPEGLRWARLLQDPRDTGPGRAEKPVAGGSPPLQILEASASAAPPTPGRVLLPPVPPWPQPGLMQNRVPRARTRRNPEHRDGHGECPTRRAARPDLLTPDSSPAAWLRA